MATHTTSDFKPGLKIIYEHEPHSIVENEFVKPGKGQAFNRARLRNLISGKLLEKTFRSGESFERAEVLEQGMQYLYQEGGFFYFMHPETFEQIAASEALLKWAKPWLLGEEVCTITLWNDQPISVLPPTFVDLKVIATDPGLKGDTVSSGGKPAVLETGTHIRIPLFVQVGERIRVDTRTATYVSRVTGK